MLTTITKLHAPQSYTKSSTHKPSKHPLYKLSHKNIKMELWHIQHHATRLTRNNKQIHPIIHNSYPRNQLMASKSTKYLQRIFLQYKMIFNNTIISTQTRHTQGQPYNNPRGGLLTLINQQYAFLGNITKIPTTTNISPYL